MLEISKAYFEVYHERLNKDFLSVFYWNLPKFLAYFVKYELYSYPTVLFHHVLAEGAHKILMHPLENTTWNHGKSNGAWIEGTMAGSMVIGRALPEWVGIPNCYTYDTPTEFADILERLLIMDDKQAMKSVLEGQEFIYNNLRLEIQNQKRAEVIERLLNLKG